MKLLMYKIITRKAFISIIYSPYNNKTTLIGFIIHGFTSVLLCLILGDREFFFLNSSPPFDSYNIECYFINNIKSWINNLALTSWASYLLGSLDHINIYDK